MSKFEAADYRRNTSAVKNLQRVFDFAAPSSRQAVSKPAENFTADWGGVHDFTQKKKELKFLMQ